MQFISNIIDHCFKINMVCFKMCLVGIEHDNLHSLRLICDVLKYNIQIINIYPY